VRRYGGELGLSVKDGCKMIGLSPSSYYYTPKVARVERDQRDAELRDRIEHIQGEFPRAGYRIVRAHLLRCGIRVNGKKIRRVMLQYGLQAQIKRKFITTTDSRHGHPVYPNRVEGLTVTGINQVWVADITYIRIRTGFVFLAVILDVFSRRVIGWAISKSLDRSVTLTALRMAIQHRNLPPGVIHHSDRGGQYACEDYVGMLTEKGFQISMSAKGNPYDNAYAESFIKTLKNEEVHLWEYENFLDVVERIPFFIEEVYNRKRLHSRIGYLPPEEFEEMLKDGNRTMKCGQLALTMGAISSNA